MGFAEVIQIFPDCARGPTQGPESFISQKPALGGARPDVIYESSGVKPELQSCYVLTERKCCSPPPGLHDAEDGAAATAEAHETEEQTGKTCCPILQQMEHSWKPSSQGLIQSSSRQHLTKIQIPGFRDMLDIQNFEQRKNRSSRA